MSTRQARMNVLRILLLIAVLAILSRYDWPCLASPTTEYPTKKLGVRSIEVQPTFELDERSSSPILHVTRESLLAFRSERHCAFPESGYEQEFAVVRAEDGTFRFESKGKKSAAAKLETVQKLLYAVNTCKWAKHGKPHVFEVSPPVTRTVLVYRDKQHQARKVTICYDMGGWYMDDFDSGHYSTVYPHLLFEVQDDIRELCQAATRTTKE